MAKLLLSCDEFIYMKDGRYYAASPDKFAFFQRYLRVFDQLKLVCRCETERDLAGIWVPLDRDKRIEVLPVPIYHGIKEYAKEYLNVGKSIRRVVNGCDAAVLRIPSTIALRVGDQVMASGMPFACEVVYDAEDGWRGYKGLSRLAWKLIDRQMRMLCSFADGVSCVTEHYLQRHYFSKKPDAFQEHYSSLALDRSFYGQPKAFPAAHTFKIAHIANQVGEQSAKGHKQTIEAVKRLIDRDVDVEVRFAGNDRQGGIERFRDYARKLGVDNHVEFVGFLDRAGVDRLLSEADIYVMPTIAEGLPRVIIEAMAKGLPCITTPVSGNPELVDRHFLVNYYETGTLADRIEELTKNPVLYENTSRSNFERSWCYEASVLEKKRDGFYGELRKRIK